MMNVTLIVRPYGGLSKFSCARDSVSVWVFQKNEAGIGQPTMLGIFLASLLNLGDTPECKLKPYVFRIAAVDLVCADDFMPICCSQSFVCKLASI